MYLSTLEPLMREGGLAIEKAQTGDFSGARKSIDRMRQLRALLEWQKQQPVFTDDEFSSGDSALASVIAVSSDMVKAITQQTEIIQSWLASSYTAFTIEQLQSSVEGRQLWLDNVLPLVWDFGQDVMMVWGEDAPLVLPLLVERGQKRIIWMTDELEQGPIPESVLGEFSIFPEAGVHLYVLACEQHCEQSVVKSLIGTAPPRFRLIGFRLDQDARRAFNRIVREISVEAISVTTIRHLSALTCRQWLEQFPRLVELESVTSLKPVFDGADVLVASPGPSLDESLETLKNEQHRFVIVAPLRAVSSLVSAGIRVDFAVWTDAQELGGLLPGEHDRRDIILLISEAAHPGMYGGGFRATFSIPDPQFHGLPLAKALHGDKAPLMAGASVAVVSALAPLQLGARSVTLVGQDLSIQNGSYASGAGVLEDEPDTPDTGLYCKGIDGEEIMTRSDYLAFVNEFCNIAIAFEGKAQLFNSTAHGAFLEGWEHVPLSANPVVLSTEPLERFRDIGSLQKDSRRDVVDIVDCLVVAESSLTCAVELCDELIKEALVLIESGSGDTVNLDARERDLKELMDDQSELLKIYTSASSIAVSSASEAVQSLEENLRLSVDYYRAISSAAEELIGLSKKARARIEDKRSEAIS